MMDRWVVLVAGLGAGCGFERRGSTIDGGIHATIEAGLDAAADAAPDMAGAPVCDPGDPALRACFTFDGDATDRSSYGNNIAATGVTYTEGRAGQGAQISAGDLLLVPASDSLNVAMLTIDAWIRPASLPAVRAGLLDSSGRYRLFLHAGGLVRCAITNGPQLFTTAANAVPVGVWTHVNCTYDGATMTIRIDGAVAATLAQSGVIPSITGGMVIGHNSPSGENFVGDLDEVRLWSAIVP